MLDDRHNFFQADFPYNCCCLSAAVVFVKGITSRLNPKSFSCLAINIKNGPRLTPIYQMSLGQNRSISFYGENYGWAFGYSKNGKSIIVLWGESEFRTRSNFINFGISNFNTMRYHYIEYNC
jgi:hypothetical protein